MLPVAAATNDRKCFKTCSVPLLHALDVIFQNIDQLRKLFVPDSDQIALFLLEAAAATTTIMMMMVIIRSILSLSLVFC